jgi:hypothetical protein
MAPPTGTREFIARQPPDHIRDLEARRRPVPKQPSGERHFFFIWAMADTIHPVMAMSKGCILKSYSPANASLALRIPLSVGRQPCLAAIDFGSTGAVDIRRLIQASS